MARRSTLIVEGPLALRMQRAAAARAHIIGRDIVSLPQMASRLAGGFQRLAGPEELYPAIRAALAQGGFADLEAVRDLPGTPRAVASSLQAAWRADLKLAALSARGPRLSDLSRIEDRVVAALPDGLLLPAALRDAALARLAHAPQVLGPITLDRLMDVDPVWRPLIVALAAVVETTWRAPTAGNRAWFPGRLELEASQAPVTAAGDVCADPHAEAVEALRWARELLSRGNIAASDIALTAPSPAAWDDHLLSLATDAELPLHFTHGVPALSTREGQACAALADALVRGLSQPRIRRLIRRIPASDFRNRLPEDWWRMLPEEAGLFSLDQWRQVLARPAAAAAAPPLLELVHLVARGPASAAEACALLLTGQARLLWEAALRIAPAEAIHISLRDLRVPDNRDPANSIAWCPAAHLAASPRPHVRMLGLTSGAWPRPEGEDAVLPDHILSRRELEAVSITDRDRQMFTVIGQAATALSTSRARRSAMGNLQAASTLWTHARERTLTRTRVPSDAFSEADRLLARSREAVALPHISASRRCWQNWLNPELTSHDGATGVQSGITLGQVLSQPQSTTSIRRLLRDPAGFVWRYALGWRSPQFEQQPLELPSSVFGELVHELIGRAIDALEPTPGIARASKTEIDHAVQGALEVIAASWPLQRAVPPPLLWKYTLDEAARLSLRGLTVDDSALADTQTWTELPFGDNETPDVSRSPWDSRNPVRIPGTNISFRGRIDRLDLRPDASAVRITDYKSGRAPQYACEIVVAGGAELQRVLYAIAVRELLPEVRRIVSRLAYLAGEGATTQLQGETLDQAMTDSAQFIAIASGIVSTGAAVPGPDARDPLHDLRLALPADRVAYLDRKQEAFEKALAPIVPLWRRP